MRKIGRKGDDMYTLASKESKEATIIQVKGIQIGGGNLTIIGGPCSVESREQMQSIAQEVKDSGAHILRGGAYKPRTSPYSFQGLGLQGLEFLSKAGHDQGLPVVTEVMSVEDFDTVEVHADILQIGARNMQNTPLLIRAGQSTKPVLLKRGMSATIEELLMAAEYIMNAGNNQVILCERGIRTFEPATRNTLDLSTVQIIKQKSHLPVFVDPSHATGDWRLVPAMSAAAVAAGADGLMIEVHNKPDEALCDGGQSLKPWRFREMVKTCKEIKEVIHRA